MPAMAPATDAGLDLEDTLRNPISGCSGSVDGFIYALISSSINLCLCGYLFYAFWLKGAMFLKGFIGHQRNSNNESILFYVRVDINLIG